MNLKKNLVNKYDFDLTKNVDKIWLETIKKMGGEGFFGTMLLPPPNITGELHLGHALDSVTQDFLVRYSFIKSKPLF
jgi:valyl-tRNA synthetase